ETVAMSDVKTADSVVWLRAKLARGPRRRNELVTEAQGAGLSWPAIESAKAKLGLVLVVQGRTKMSAGGKPVAWATKKQCEELDLELWRPGTTPAAGAKKGPVQSFQPFTVQESLRLRGQRVMDDSHGE
ncbi:MAG: hypothetical protein ACXVRH_12350, partial [Thermoleophilaceae bacterium]